MRRLLVLRPDHSGVVCSSGGAAHPKRGQRRHYELKVEEERMTRTFGAPVDSRPTLMLRAVVSTRCAVPKSVQPQEGTRITCSRSACTFSTSFEKVDWLDTGIKVIQGAGLAREPRFERSPQFAPEIRVVFCEQLQQRARPQNEHVP
jgi:hypothetical protein